MGKLIGTGNSDNFGEKLFVEKVQEYLDDTNIIYWNREVFGREFDVCILMPGKGILVVELKGWREKNILRVENNDAVIIRTDDGEVLSSPQKQSICADNMYNLFKLFLGQFLEGVPHKLNNGGRILTTAISANPRNHILQIQFLNDLYN